MTTPDWDIEQLEVIIDPPSSWQLVTAGPGAGKSAVACQRVAYLIDEGVPASRILLISFTRTAVTELRDRIVSYAVAGLEARRIRISTIDSHAWSLRAGFDDVALSKSVGNGSYDLSIARTVELFREGNTELHEFMGTIEHLIVDEAQDIMGVRADLIVEVLRSLGSTCGVTILADPAQAIYGFTTDEDDRATGSASLLSQLESAPPRALIRRTLNQIHRIKSADLSEVFLRARKEIELADNPAGHVERVQDTIRKTCGKDIGVSSYENIAEFLAPVRDDSMLVLYRRRADVLFASSYCSRAGIEHRVRMSETPVVVRPWIGWLFGGLTASFLEKAEFESLWQQKSALASAPFAAEKFDDCWGIVHRLAAGRWPETVDLEQLRRIVARPRPPVELCLPDVGYYGPILGTIHASKGREADTVVLVMPPTHERSEGGDNADDVAEIFEEGRVYYVGATRARRMLIAANGPGSPVGRLDSNRVFRNGRSGMVQLEIGRDGDVDRLAHLAWSNSADVQMALARSIGATANVHARTVPEQDYVWRLVLDQKGADGITRQLEVGQLSQSFDYDIKRLWSRVDSEGKLRPPMTIPYLYLVGATTVGIAEDQRWAVKHPFNQSGMALAPVVKGFSPVQFVFRRQRRPAE